MDAMNGNLDARLGCDRVGRVARRCSKRSALSAKENTPNAQESIEYLCHHLSV